MGLLHDDEEKEEDSHGIDHGLDEPLPARSFGTTDTSAPGSDSAPQNASRDEGDRQSAEPAPPPPPCDDSSSAEPTNTVHTYVLELRLLSAAREWPPDPKSPHQRTVPADHPLRKGPKYYVGAYYQTKSSAPQLPLSRSSRWATKGRPGRVDNRRELSEEEYKSLEAVCLWPKEPGRIALATEADGLAKGVVRVTDFKEQETSTTRGGEKKVWHKKIAEAWVVDGVAAFTARQMRQNVESEPVSEIKRLNEKASRTWTKKIQHVVRELDEIDRFDCATAVSPYGRSAGEAAANLVLERQYHLRYIQTRIQNLSHVPSRERRNAIHALDDYHSLKSAAFWTWGKLVRTKPFVRESQNLGEKAFAAIKGIAADLLAGSGRWDFKPVLYQAWGSRNRLGNGPAVYKYDIWSNIHYGYVGKAAGFTNRELIWGANAQQEADTGTKDNSRDQEAIRAGSALYESNPKGVSYKSLMSICENRKPTDYNKETGWGYLDFSLKNDIQKKREIRK